MNLQSPIVLLTRPAAQSIRFAKELRAYFDGEIIISPILRIELTDRFAQIPLDQALIFTSARAVEAYARHQIKRGHVAFCVGTRTADAAQKAGCVAHAAAGDAADLFKFILKLPPQKAVYLCGQHRHGALDDKLRANGMIVETRVVYNQIAQPLNDAGRAALSAQAPVIAPVFSPRSAALLSAQMQNANSALILVFISAAAAKAWQGGGCPQIVADNPNAPAMINAIRAQLTQVLGLRAIK